jgi:hypothetical protein
LPFAAASTPAPVLPGPWHVSFAAAGTTTELVGLDANLPAGGSFSYFAIGLAGQAGGALQRKVLAVVDDLTAPAAGTARLRFLHASPDAGVLDAVQVGAAGAIAGYLSPNLAYPGPSTYASMAPGTYTLAVVPHQATSPLLPSAQGVSVTLEDGDAITVVVGGCRNPGVGSCASTSAPSALQLSTLKDR